MFFKISKKELQETLKVYDNLEINKSIDSAVDRYFNEKREEDAHYEELLTELGTLRSQNKIMRDANMRARSRISSILIADAENMDDGLYDKLTRIGDILDTACPDEDLDFPN